MRTVPFFLLATICTLFRRPFRPTSTIVDDAIEALSAFAPDDREQATELLFSWKRRDELQATDAVAILDRLFPEAEDPGVIEVADGHLVHACCGKIDDAEHRNFCEFYGTRSPSEQLLAETAARWDAESRQFAARMDERTAEHRDDSRFDDPRFCDGYAVGFLEALEIALAAKRHPQPITPAIRAFAEDTIRDLQAEADQGDEA
ncbi:hypothetical protein [Actinoplanes philippinensis]|uniref:hypothetical protein n=1 Tax=Actinoplanes philippinensis TaxID=35752 RepID=UPI00340580E6